MARASRKMAVSFLVGVVVLGAAGFIAFVAGTAASGLPWAATTEVSAQFDNVGTLKPGSEVRENSVRVGKVKSIEYADGHALVTLSLDGHVPVYADARAAVSDQSALAKKFVELDRGHPQAGSLGNREIDLQHNLGATDLDNVLNVFDPQTRDKLSSALRELGNGVAGQSQNLHDVLEKAPPILNDVGAITNALASPQADLPRLLNSVNDIAGAFSGHQQELAALVGETANTFDAVGVDNGRPLQDALKGLPDTLRDADAAMDALNVPLADTQQAMTDLGPGAVSLGRSTADLRGVLREAIPPLGKVPGVAGQAAPAVDDLTATVADARPLAPRLSEGLDDLATPLSVLAPYSLDIVRFFGRANSMVSTSTAPGRHVARLGLSIPGLSVVAGGLLPDPMSHRIPYPAPGQADSYRAGLLPGGSK
ncbi:MCE family protein [Amycolatopsis sp. K13G38]|uniref:MCE family protein n=1 Tax=Amycolatopsis acididurans TaxID=2724524 RepID=A0ABX1J3P1_9PSEU|nr:MlaD family protein [Amycolatopsis acididurans]NKQ54244.1 MCE family protein [Amycolatopsis acididurans]